MAFGYRWPGDWPRVFAGIDYCSEPGEGVENERYLHVCYNHWLAARLQSFHFVHAQASRTGRLRHRLLLGSGLRSRVAATGRTTFDVGT